MCHVLKLYGSYGKPFIIYLQHTDKSNCHPTRKVALYPNCARLYFTGSYAKNLVMMSYKNTEWSDHVTNISS